MEAALGSAAGGGAVAADAEGRRLSVPVADRMAGLAEAVRVLAAAGIEAADLAVRRPTLDEVFLHLTGDGAAGGTGGAAGARPAAAAAGYADKEGTTV